jgi:hypothetical protein
VERVMGRVGVAHVADKVAVATRVREE